MNPPPPYDSEAHDRFLREARIKEIAYARGIERGRMEASALFERRLEDAEKKLEALWRAFETDETRVLQRPEGPNSG